MATRIEMGDIVAMCIGSLHKHNTFLLIYIHVGVEGVRDEIDAEKGRWYKKVAMRMRKFDGEAPILFAFPTLSTNTFKKHD